MYTYGVANITNEQRVEKSSFPENLNLLFSRFQHERSKACMYVIMECVYNQRSVCALCVISDVGAFRYGL